MKFSYSKLPSHNPNLKWIARPYIPIQISGPKRFWEGYGLIDSGADRCLFNSKIAEDIGLDLLKLPQLKSKSRFINYHMPSHRLIFWRLSGRVDR